VKLEATLHNRGLEVTSDSNDRYQATFYRSGQLVGAVSWGIGFGAGLRVVRLAVPTQAAAAGYDEIGIAALYGDGAYSIGHVVPVD